MAMAFRGLLFADRARAIALEHSLFAAWNLHESGDGSPDRRDVSRGACAVRTGAIGLLTIFDG